jgi:putative oxidoreductase
MSEQVTTREDWGKLCLRVSIGGLMLFHGLDKLLNGVAGIEGMLAAKGLPAAAVYGVYVGEVIAPLLILAGVFVRSAGLLLAINMVVAIGMAHSGDLFALSPHGGWAVELQMLYLLGGLALALMGGGRIGFMRKA